ncbi:type VI secretion system protein ImpA [Devosia sp. UYZn731]|uniref:type VI secretion system protein TssA n=1 Tax=Devosia sp. UYZn731 TaxID=3156345 RepID=UPI0033987A45
MRFDFLADPISDSAPAGPDLEEAGDEAYTNYMMLASSRLPQRFFQNAEPGSDRAGAPFDKSSIDLASETAAIDALLQRSRDLRLLTLDARFQILSGSIPGFAEAIAGIATVVGVFWDTFHPLPFEDGDQIMRTNCVEGLVDYAQIILPLQHAYIVRGERVRPITFRNFLVETNKVEARAGEERVSLDVIERNLDADAAQSYVTTVREAVDLARKSLDAIRNSFIEHAGYESAPKFDVLSGVLDGMAGLMARDGSNGKAIVPASGEPVEDFAAPRPGALSSPTLALASVAAAKGTLLAAENFFRIKEASNPALVLIHQARMLIGRPLVEALESLLPDTANRATFRFETGPFPFEIDLSRMRTVTEDLLAEQGNAQGDENEESTVEPEQLPTSREEAAQLLTAVEQFFRSNEPSSPVPVLLARARLFINKDFNSILVELMPKAD